MMAEDEAQLALVDDENKEQENVTRLRCVRGVFKNLKSSLVCHAAYDCSSTYALDLLTGRCRLPPEAFNSLGVSPGSYFAVVDARKGESREPDRRVVISFCSGYPLKPYVTPKPGMVVAPRVIFTCQAQTAALGQYLVPISSPPQAASVFCRIVRSTEHHCSTVDIMPEKKKSTAFNNLSVAQRQQLTASLRGLLVCPFASILSPCRSFCFEVTR